MLLPFPNKFGRKGSLNIVLSFYLVASGLSIYSKSIPLKMLGMFFQGFFHIKNTLSYSLISEISTDNKKELCITLLNLFDNISVFIMATTFQYYSKDAIGLLDIRKTTGSCIIILFLLFAPESPFYLIAKGDEEEGIRSLNYIAWFNGSKNRIPTNINFVSITKGAP